MRLITFLLFFMYTLSQCRAQVAASGIYKFMNLHPSARIASLGGINVSIIDKDLNLSLQNPALINTEMRRQVAFNTVNFVSDINLGYAAYAFGYGPGTCTVGLQYINYGKFQGASATGVPTGTFTAGEYNLHISYGRQFKRFSYGSSLKLIYSNMNVAKSTGIATDLGTAYRSKDSLFTAGLVVKNLGYQLTTYTAGNREKLPFEIQAGFSKKLKHMPLRLSVTAHNLQKFDLTYNNPNKPGQQTDLATGEPVVEKITFADKAMRHLIIGSELLLSKNFHFRFGYNHMRRKEMTIEGKRGMVGFAWGFGIRLNRFLISYGSSSFYIGQNTNHFSFAANLNDFRRKIKVQPNPGSGK
ncbi:MAG: type IX secretion system protein PorQ [Bacteroidia bacterium]|nr:type IX secretion system protein PorQ [Bacteroidia bacterium]